MHPSLSYRPGYGAGAASARACDALCGKEEGFAALSTVYPVNHLHQPLSPRRVAGGKKMPLPPGGWREVIEHHPGFSIANAGLVHLFDGYARRPDKQTGI